MKWSNKYVLLTGAAGFIGQALLRRLLKLGANVIAIDNFSIGTKENIEFFEGDLVVIDVSSREFVPYIRQHIRQLRIELDFIFHFGAPSSVVLFNRDPEKAFRETISGFINIMELAASLRPKKVIYASSGSVYGNTPPPQSESMPPRPVNLYGIAKLTTEMIASFYLDQVQSVGLRIFAGYGPGEDHKGDIASPVTLFLKSIIKDQKPIVFGDGNQSRDFVYIDDIVEAIIRSAERETPPIINVGSGKTYTFNQVISLINDLLGKNISPRYINRPPKYLEKTQADITLMREFLGIEPLELKEGLKKYLKHLQIL